MARRRDVVVVRHSPSVCTKRSAGVQHLCTRKHKPPWFKCCAEFDFRQSPMARCCMQMARNAVDFLSRESFPYHHRIPRDLNLSAFLARIQSAPLRAQYEAKSAWLPIIVHRHPLASGQVPPVRFVTTHGDQTLRPFGCTAVECERCDKRGGYKWPWDGPWVCVAGPPDRSGSLVEIQTVQVMEASETSQQSPKGSDMGSQVPIAIHHPTSEEVRVLRVARRAIRQFCRENVHFRSSAGRDLRSASGGQSSSHDRGRHAYVK